MQSCIKVALDFVSPENVGELIQLTDDIRLLPQNHKAKEDKLGVNNLLLLYCMRNIIWSNLYHSLKNNIKIN